MKKVIFVFVFVLFSLSLVSSLTIDMNEEYSRGESLIAKVSGNFYSPLTESNVKFYRNNSQVSFGFFSLDKIEEDYYVSVSIPTERVPGDYSLRIVEAEYFVGEEFKTDDVVKGFILLDKMSFVQVSPSLKNATNYSYNISVKNIFPERINLTYNVEGYPEKYISINTGETKNLNLMNYGGNKFQRILYNYGNETYSSLVYVNLPEISGEPVSNETPEDPIIDDENETELNETDESSWWDIIFGGGEPNVEEENNLSNNVSNEPEENNTPLNEIPTCSELGLIVCGEDESCDGTNVEGRDSQCCKGSCVEEESSGAGLSTIGWILLGAAAIFLAWFFKFKFSKARGTPGGLLRR